MSAVVRNLVLAVTLFVGVSTFSPGGAAALEITPVVSKSGVRAWLVHDATVPVISMSFTFRGGAALDPPGKAGLARMVSGLLDEGAGDLESQAFQKALEKISASISFDAGLDRFSGSLRTLSAKRDEAFRLLALALTKPRFDAAPVERIRTQILVSLKEDSEEPRRIAGKTWFRTVFPDHPYGRPVSGTPETVQALTADDLRTFVSQRFAREDLIVGVAGDITADELARRLDEVFGALPEKPETAAVPEVKPDAAGQTIVIRKTIPQSVVVFGEAGLKRKDPDYYAAYVMNHILGGGGFSSRLTEEVREKRGLAYSVYSYLSPLDHSALILGGVGTRNESVAKSIDIVREEWRRMAREGASEEEMAAAKTYLNGSFPLRLDSSGRIAQMLVSIQYYDLGLDYIDRRPKLINAVTQEDVLRVARRLLDPKALAIVVVGDPEGLEGAKELKE